MIPTQLKQQPVRYSWLSPAAPALAFLLQTSYYFLPAGGFASGFTGNAFGVFGVAAGGGVAGGAFTIS